MNNAEKIATRALGKTHALEQGFAVLLDRIAQKYEDPEKFIVGITDAIRDCAAGLGQETEGAKVLAKAMTTCADDVQHAALNKRNV
jgi:hypothetical protein